MEAKARALLVKEFRFELKRGASLRSRRQRFDDMSAQAEGETAFYSGRKRPGAMGRRRRSFYLQGARIAATERRTGKDPRGWPPKR